MSNNKEQDIEQQKSQIIVEMAPETEKADPNKESPDTNEKPTADSRPTLTEVSKEIATEDEKSFSDSLTLAKILGGDLLNTSTIRGQVYVLLLITFFLILYISNRYSCQKSLIEIDRLNKELLDAKYKALSSNSQLTEKSRESHILEILKAKKDSTLHTPEQPPFIIPIPDNE